MRSQSRHLPREIPARAFVFHKIHGKVSLRIDGSFLKTDPQTNPTKRKEKILSFVPSTCKTDLQQVSHQSQLGENTSLWWMKPAVFLLKDTRCYQHDVVTVAVFNQDGGRARGRLADDSSSRNGAKSINCTATKNRGL